MAYPKGLNDPVVQAKRKEMGMITYPISRKAVLWAEENGYTALMRDVDRFMTAYRKANAPQDYYSTRTREQLEEILRVSERRAAKAAAALASSNGHH